MTAFFFLSDRGPLRDGAPADDWTGPGRRGRVACAVRGGAAGPPGPAVLCKPERGVGQFLCLALGL